LAQGFLNNRRPLAGSWLQSLQLSAAQGIYEQHERHLVVKAVEITNVLGRPSPPHGPLRRLLRSTIHLLSYRFVLTRRTTTVSRAAGFRLTVPPTVFHPRIFITSEFFAGFLERLDLAGKHVAEVGTGSGILALAAAKAGAARVVAIDINPNAARAAAANARANGLDSRVTGVCSNLLSAIAPRPLFDVILSSPPSFPGEPRDLADRAWHAGPGYRDIASLFDQARERLSPGGRLYVLLSSDSDLNVLGALIARAGFRARLVAERSILFESFILYELRASDADMEQLEQRSPVTEPRRHPAEADA
jgi:release factor glutamine methyltransferase